MTIYSDVVRVSRDRESLGYAWSNRQLLPVDTKVRASYNSAIRLDSSSCAGASSTYYTRFYAAQSQHEGRTPRVHDVWHEIISHLEHDKQALQALCLVDKTMNALSSKFLWRSVHLRTKPHRFARFKDAIQALMNEQKPYATYVRKLRIFSPTCSSFGGKEKNSDRKYDYYRDVCARFRRHIIEVLPRLMFLESFEWSTTLHLCSELLTSLAIHPSLIHVDISPGSDQTWASLSLGHTSAFSLLPLHQLTNLSLTIPNIFTDQYDPPTSRITEALARVIPAIPHLTSISLRLTPLPSLTDEEMYALYAFPTAEVLDTPQAELESQLFHEIHKMTRRNRDKFRLRLTGLDFPTMWKFIHRYHPLQNVTSLSIMDKPSNGVIHRKSSMRQNDNTPLDDDDDDIIYDYEYRAPGNLLVRDCSVLQVILLKMYGQQLRELDIEHPNVAVELVAAPKLRRLRTGICMANGIDWDVAMVNKIAKRCTELESLELLVPWDWKWWRMCWRRRDDPSFAGLLAGYDKLTNLEISVERPSRTVGVGMDPREDLRDPWKQRQRWLKDMLPSREFVPYLLRNYPSLSSVKVGTSNAVSVHSGVRQDRERLDAALMAFKILPPDDPISTWSPVQGLFN